MILEIFSIYLILAISLYFYGWYAKNHFYHIIASILILFIGFSLEPAFPSPIGDIQYKSGFTETVAGNITTTVYNYSTYTNHTAGLYIILLGIFSMVIVWFERRSQDES